MTLTVVHVLFATAAFGAAFSALSLSVLAARFRPRRPFSAPAGIGGRRYGTRW
jgi:hypothetical protein